MEASFYDMYATTEAIYALVTMAISLISLIFSTMIWVFVLALLCIPLMIGAIAYIIEAIPLYKLAKKAGKQYPWIAWIPIYSQYCRTYVISDLLSDKPWEVELFNKKWVLNNRLLSVGIYAGIGLFGPTIVGMMAWTPLAPILFFLPAIATGIMEYVYLRDFLNAYREDAEANQKTAILITIADYFVFGMARAILISKLVKKEAFPEAFMKKTVEVEKVEGEVR